MQRRVFLSQVLRLGMAAGAAGLLPDSVLSADSASGNRPPNIIILLNDDQGWGDLGCQGHPFIQTPAIDRLAASGCRFTNFYVSSPVCSPSRAGLLTGRIQNRFGMQHLINDGSNAIPVFHHVPLEEPTLPRVLCQAGYRTGHIGKWHLSFAGRDGEPTMADYGYDESLILGAGRHTSYFSSRWQRGAERIETKDRWSAEVYVDEAIKFIERSGNQPFFLNLWSFTPHAEVDCAPRYRELYKDRPEEEQYYLGAITQMDEQYGRLLDYLDRAGLAENTVVVFSSDNGPEPHLIPWTERARGSTGGLRGGKHHLYEGGIRVPGIIRWPGMSQAGSVSHEPAWTPDLLATFAAAAGGSLPADKPLDGVDLRPALADRPLERPHPLYWQFPIVGVGLRDGTRVTSPPLALREDDWKLLCDEKFENVELYNLLLDQNEKWNMRDKYPEIAARLLGQLKTLHAEINGPYSREARFINPAMPLAKPESGKD